MFFSSSPHTVAHHTPLVSILKEHVMENRTRALLETRLQSQKKTVNWIPLLYNWILNTRADGGCCCLQIVTWPYPSVAFLSFSLVIIGNNFSFGRLALALSFCVITPLISFIVSALTQTFFNQTLHSEYRYSSLCFIPASPLLNPAKIMFWSRLLSWLCTCI